MNWKLYIAVAAGLFSAGCSRSADSGESWYDGARDHTQKRDAYVDQFGEQGVSELDAKKSWRMDQIIGNAHGTYREHEVSADEVQGL